MPFLIISWIPDIRLYNVVFFLLFSIFCSTPFGPGLHPGVVMQSGWFDWIVFGVMSLLGRFADDEYAVTMN